MSARPAGYKASRSEYLALRNRRCHMRRWGDPAAPLLFLYHGFCDFSISYQFVVDHLARDWNIVAPDRRGTGPSQWDGDCYSWMDQIADIDAILAHYSPEAPARVVAHSQGAANMTLYAGLRPQRIAGLVSLEGFGPPPVREDRTLKRIVRFLDEMRAGPAPRAYADHAAMAASLTRNNPRLTPERAAFLVQHIACAAADGQGVTYALDPWLNVPTPIPYGKRLQLEAWPKVSAPVLLVWGLQSAMLKLFRELNDFDDRVAALKTARQVFIDDAGHNLHQDQPERIAALIEEFFVAA